jgi:hypothetical protein
MPNNLSWNKINTSQWVPNEVKAIAKSIQQVVPPLITALSFTTKILNIVKMFIVNIDDALKILLTQVETLIDNFINSLTESGIYVLYILPRPGINPQTNPEYFLNLLPQDFDLFDPNNPTWFDGVKGGYSSFVAKVVNSFDDPGDSNRPQFPDSAMMGAYVMMFDSGTALSPDNIAAFVSSIQKLMRLFRSPFRVAFEPPTNVTTFASNGSVRITFTPSASILPKEYFIFRSEVQGGYNVTDSTGNVYRDESGKPVHAWKLIGITNVGLQLASIMKVSQAQATTWLQSAAYSAKALSTAVLGGDPFRFVFEDVDVDNDTSYFYVIAAGYTTLTAAKQSDYDAIVTPQDPRQTPINFKETEPDDSGVYTSDFEKKINILGVEQDIIPISQTKIAAVGNLSAEVSAKPITITLEVKGGLARCRNFRCGFQISETEIFDLAENLSNTNSTLRTLAEKPIAGSVSISIKRQGKTFEAQQSAYRVDYSLGDIYAKNIYYFQSGDNLTISYEYTKALSEQETTESGTLGSDLTYLTQNKPIDSSSVQVFFASPLFVELQPVSAANVTILNDKDGRIKVSSYSPGTVLTFKYQYYTDFSDSSYFKCIRPEYSRYFFDIKKCDAGSTLCPGYDDVNCVFNTGALCTNTALSQRPVLSTLGGLSEYYPENIAFNLFWDPIACQNGIMQQRCDGYNKISKIAPRYPQKTWPDWASEQLDVLGMFPKIKEVVTVMNRLIDSLISGTGKMDSTILTFINLLQKKIDSLKQFIELINSFVQILENDFSLPNLYFLEIPFAAGGNNYIKTSIQNATNGPIADSTSYTGGMVLAFGTPGIGDALKIFFG